MSALWSYSDNALSPNRNSPELDQSNPRLLPEGFDHTATVSQAGEKIPSHTARCVSRADTRITVCRDSNTAGWPNGVIDANRRGLPRWFAFRRRRLRLESPTIWTNGRRFDGADTRSKIVGALGESVQTVATLRSGHVKERMVYIQPMDVHRAHIQVIRVLANERPYIDDEAGFCCVRREGAGHGTLDV